MHANTYQDSTGTLNVLERYEAEEGKSSEATWFPATWRSSPSGQRSLPPKAIDPLACVRVEKAKNLLLNPHYHFTEIAAELDFASIADFNQAFTRIVGELPHAYRARVQPAAGRAS